MIIVRISAKIKKCRIYLIEMSGYFTTPYKAKMIKLTID